MPWTGRVVIVGGGIGGLSAAIALQRRGVAAEVYEAAPELRAVGAGIMVPGNALEVLARLGLAGEVAAAGVELERVEVRDVGGAVLQAMELHRAGRRRGRGMVAIRRSELQRILATGVAPGTLHLGCECEGFLQEPRGVAVRFRGGATVHADLLVAADGIGSAVRRQMLPASRLRYSGQSCYRGLVTAELPEALSRTTREVWGGAARFGFAPVAEGEVYWFAPFLAPAGREPDPARLPAELARLYAGFPEPIPQLVSRIDPARVTLTELYDLAPIPRWWEGDVALLGDAAHAATPNLGQGGAQAIEDAWVLAECLARHADSRAALAEYQRLRLPRARWIASQSWRMGKLAHLQGRLARAARNALLRGLPASLAERQAERMLALPY